MSFNNQHIMATCYPDFMSAFENKPHSHKKRPIPHITHVKSVKSAPVSLTLHPYGLHTFINSFINSTCHKLHETMHSHHREGKK